MRKRTINYCFDKILWGIIMLLPIILYLAFIIFYLNGQRDLGVQLDNILDNQLSILSFSHVMTLIFGWFQDLTAGENLFYATLRDIFYNYFQFEFDGSDMSFIIWYAVYIMMVEFLHILVDVILLLPRICRKFLDKFKAEDC